MWIIFWDFSNWMNLVRSKGFLRYFWAINNTNPIYCECQLIIFSFISSKQNCLLMKIMSVGGINYWVGSLSFLVKEGLMLDVSKNINWKSHRFLLNNPHAQKQLKTFGTHSKVVCTTWRQLGLIRDFIDFFFLFTKLLHEHSSKGISEAYLYCNF